MRAGLVVPMVFGFMVALGCSAEADKLPSPRSAPRAAKPHPVKAAPKAAAADAALADLTAPVADPQADQPKVWWPPSASVGPATVQLREQATFEVPEGFLYLNQDDTNVLLERLGNRKDERTIGGILPKDISNAKYFLIIEWDGVGYVKDDEADKLDAAAILDSIREGTQEDNKFRQEKGMPEISVVGWDEPPRYDKESRHIVWAIRGRSTDGETVNFNTRLLGREGYLSMNLICDPAQLAGLKPTIADLLGRAAYNSGKRYTDFVKGKDKVAEFGLAALVIGGAALAGKAVKLGLLAKFGKVLLALLIAGKKAFVLLLVAAGAFLRRLFGGKSQTPPPPATGAAEPPAAATEPTAAAVATAEPAPSAAAEPAPSDDKPAQS